MSDTRSADYTKRLTRLETSGIKRLLPTQAPYRWNLRRLKLGRVLDVGCGLGRNLLNCSPQSVGVDHNAHSVATCRERGLTAYTPDELAEAPDCGPGSFDSLLCAHVLEHMDEALAVDVLAQYLPLVKPGGKVVLITPQEAGYKTDATHVRFVGFEELREHAETAKVAVARTYSFPFPRPVGKVFPYNEFVLVGTLPA
ncbi:class I SAM-dependent methyltransferase [Streptomyces roseirectus]|uniref:Class I SAM-dependent methyltransferase n=1 Tax=Streptomyces roseirectus TaxID=2768066 RepID=A0A7H0IIR8_9ACTN|nr:class I SAM-dependent methyltransferase [Streptomyces roseirectus]QNP72684.1 class I SAM-dependent methyltransferase [Streptomyces roseirectus]